MRILLLSLSISLFLSMNASAASKSCPELKTQAVGKHHKCITLAQRGGRKGTERRLERCDWRLERNIQNAEKSFGCDGVLGAEEIDDVVNTFSDSIIEAASGRTGVPEIVATECDLDQVDLLDFEAWRREEGFWIGEYSFFGADGEVNQSTSWPYKYHPYKGFIRIEIDGPNLAQRNIFTYPPQDPSLCTGEEGDVKGSGTCGEHGNENIWVANQSASNCKGSLDGPFPTAYGVTDTYTTVIGEDTVHYKVVYSPNNPPPFGAMFGGKIMQNQLTTLTPNGVRIRTAQGIDLATGLPSYSSYYRETRVTEEEFWEALDAARAEYNILESDHCAWDGVTKGPSGTTCEEHFE